MTISIYSKRFRVHARLAAIFFVAAIAVALMSFIHRGPSTLETNRVINITADIFCMVLGLVLFLCCGSDTQWDQDNLNYFLLMIITTFVAAFTDEYAWLVDGKASMVMANKIRLLLGHAGAGVSFLAVCNHFPECGSGKDL